MADKVVHDAEKSIFYMKMEDGSMALVEYEKSGDTLDMYHTEVPPQYRGRGLGDKLVIGALDIVAENKLKVQPSCPFVKKVIMQSKVPKYMALLVTKGRF